jgi:translocation and assembly module TamB
VKRVLAVAVGVLLSLVLALVIAAGAAWRSPAAAAWLLELAQPLVPGELQLAGVSGSLADGLGFAQIDYRLDALTIRARDARIVIGWPALLRAELQLRRVLAAELSVRQAPGAASDDPAVLPEIGLPLVVSIDSLRIDRLQLDLGGLSEQLDDVRARARWADSTLSLRRLSAARPGLSAQASGELQFVGRWPLSLALQWQADDAGLSGEGELSGDFDRLLVTHLLRVPDEVRLSGQIADLLGTPRIDLRGDWDEIGLQITDANTLAVRAGQLALTGGLDEYRLELATQLAIDGVPEVSLAAQASGNLEELLAERIELNSAFGGLKGQARAGFSPLSLDGDFAARDWNPEALVDGWPGSLGFQLGFEADGDGNVSVRISELRGSLRELPVAGAARLRRTGERLSVEDAELRVGDNRLSARLVSTPELDGRFDLDASDLSALWPGLNGSATGSGRVSGTPDRPALAAQLAVANLVYQGQAIDSFELRAAIDPEQRVDLRLQAGGISSGELALGDLELTVFGATDAYELDLALRDGPLRASLAGSGGWAEGLLTQAIARGELDAGVAGPWSLDAPFELRLSADSFTAAAHCWSQSSSRLCVEAIELAGNEQRAAARLDGLPLVVFAGLVAEDLSVDGKADASLAYRRSDENWQLELDWRQSDTLLGFATTTDDAIETAIDVVQLSLRADETQAVLRGRIAGDYGLAVEFGGEISDPLSTDAGLNLRLLATLPDLSLPAPLIARFLPLERVGGRVEVDLNLTGSRAMPRLGGYARLTEARAFVPLAGIDLEAVELSLVPGSGDEIGLLTAGAESGGGRLELDGAVKLADERGLYIEARLRGDRFQAVRFPNQSVHVSPDLQLIVDQQLVDVQGRVLVPRARIEVEELPASAQTPSGDIVVHYEIDPPEPRQRYAYGVIGSLDLSLGDDVVFRGFGLDTRLGGRLKLARASVEEPFRADGSLRTIAGRFRAARRELSIDRGVLIFTGALDDPSLDVRAVREVTWEGRDYRAGVLLTGPVSEIRTEVFGEPAMGETDALSFLVLGRPATDLSDSAGSELSGTAVALGLVGMLPVTEQLQESLMLDEISFAGSGGQDTSVVAGKRLSEDVFVRYTYGLFDRVGTFLVRYDVGRGFSLEAGSGREQTLEIIYSIDR